MAGEVRALQRSECHVTMDCFAPADIVLVAMASTTSPVNRGRDRCSLSLLAVYVALLAAGFANAAEINMRVFQLNDHLLCFYDGRPPEPTTPPTNRNWADFGAQNVGVATYVIHRGDRALVYDTYPSTQQARWVRDYLVKIGIRRFTVVNSHWHLDHVGGNAIYADVDRISTALTMQRLIAKKSTIEAGTEWGPPAISPLVIPNIGITADTAYMIDDIEVDLRPVNIHSEDGLVLYLPRDRVLLAGDTLEDTVTFIVEPDQIGVQYKNLQRMKEWKIDRIFPNQRNPSD